MKKLLQTLLFALLILLVFMGYNSFRFNSIQLEATAVDLTPTAARAIHRFAQALTIPTVSPENENDFDSLAFFQFNDYLKTTYPLSDSLLEKKTFNHFSHLFKWKGRQSDLKPVVLMAHLDVVPVIEENLPDWKHPPFAGRIINDTLWGRGAIDDKIGVIGLLEATESLLKKGFQP